MAAAPIDPKLKEMASGVLNKAEAVVKAIEAGEPVKDVAVGLAKEVASSDAVTKVTETASASVATATAAAAAATVTVAVEDAPAIIGLLVTSPADASQPPSVQATAPAPPTPPEVTAVPAEDLKDGGKTEAVQDWGASK